MRSAHQNISMHGHISYMDLEILMAEGTARIESLQLVKPLPISMLYRMARLPCAQGFNKVHHCDRQHTLSVCHSVHNVASQHRGDKAKRTQGFSTVTAYKHTALVRRHKKSTAWVHGLSSARQAAISLTLKHKPISTRISKHGSPHPLTLSIQTQSPNKHVPYIHAASPLPLLHVKGDAGGDSCCQCACSCGGSSWSCAWPPTAISSITSNHSASCGCAAPSPFTCSAQNNCQTPRP